MVALSAVFASGKFSQVLCRVQIIIPAALRLDHRSRPAGGDLLRIRLRSRAEDNGDPLCFGVPGESFQRGLLIAADGIAERHKVLLRVMRHQAQRTGIFRPLNGVKIPPQEFPAHSHIAQAVRVSAKTVAHHRQILQRNGFKMKHKYRSLLTIQEKSTPVTVYHQNAIFQVLS